MSKVDIYEMALIQILRKAHRRKMVKTPPSIREFYDDMCIGKRNELAEIFEELGDIAKGALELAEGKDD